LNAKPDDIPMVSGRNIRRTNYNWPSVSKRTESVMQITAKIRVIQDYRIAVISKSEGGA